jgi:hypothetical protein
MKLLLDENLCRATTLKILLDQPTMIEEALLNRKQACVEIFEV